MKDLVLASLCYNKKKKEADHEKTTENRGFGSPASFGGLPGRLRSGPKTEGRKNRGLAGEDQ